jgi:hypothetical protein
MPTSKKDACCVNKTTTFLKTTIHPLLAMRHGTAITVVFLGECIARVRSIRSDHSYHGETGYCEHIRSLSSSHQAARRILYRPLNVSLVSSGLQAPGYVEFPQELFDVTAEKDNKNGCAWKLSTLFD